MATNWNQEQQNIFNDLSKEGVMFTFVRSGKGDFDPVSGEYAAVDEVTFQAPGIEKMYNYKTSYAQSFLLQTTVQAGDKVLLLACGSTDIELQDTVLVNGVPWVVTALTPLSPGGVDLIRYVLIRRA